MVLEIGVGSGRNLPFYSSAVHRVMAIDPSEELLKMARRQLNNAGTVIDLVEASAESLPLANASIVLGSCDFASRRTVASRRS
ncbi:MAG TPA: class I SAM-dependent methyltransferase [Casimicrobiaceae bacterium]|nr:class I SAM-dependent methyltransferase [Casimicrobiaceae bacterium]